MIFYAKEEEMIEIRSVDDSGVLQPSGWFYLKYACWRSSGVALKATWILHPGHILRQASPKHQSGWPAPIETQMF